MLLLIQVDADFDICVWHAAERALLDDEVLRELTGGMDVLGIFQLLSAQVAASCAKLSEYLHTGTDQVCVLVSKQLA